LATSYSFSFTTGAAPDNTPPAVSSTSPLNGAAGVAANTSVTETVSASSSPASLTTGTFLLIGGGGAVTGTVSYTGTTATFTPSSSLAFGTTYTATITTGATDAAGNPLAANYSFSFTTGAAPDTTPPTVSSTSPVNGAAGVAVNTSVT